MPLIPPPPPQSYTATEAARLLGISRQRFYASGLNIWLAHWLDAAGNKHYAAAGVQHLAALLQVRRDRIAAGELPGNSPLLPPKKEDPI